jgi:hypothetical protein
MALAGPGQSGGGGGSRISFATSIVTKQSTGGLEMSKMKDHAIDVANALAEMKQQLEALDANYSVSRFMEFSRELDGGRETGHVKHIYHMQFCGVELVLDPDGSYYISDTTGG